MLTDFQLSDPDNKFVIKLNIPHTAWFLPTVTNGPVFCAILYAASNNAVNWIEQYTVLLLQQLFSVLLQLWKLI